MLFTVLSCSPICYSWEGGKQLAYSPDYDEIVVTREDYEENGHCICEEKFDIWLTVMWRMCSWWPSDSSLTSRCWFTHRKWNEKCLFLHVWMSKSTEAKFTLRPQAYPVLLTFKVYFCWEISSVIFKKCYLIFKWVSAILFKTTCNLIYFGEKPQTWFYCCKKLSLTT